MSNETEVKIRRLQTSDLFTLARIISKSTDDLQPRIESLLERKLDKKQEAILLGMAVFESGFRQAANELQEWLAGMVDPPMEVEEFGKLPLDTPLGMIDSILEHEKETLPDFLSRLQDLVAKGQSIFSSISSRSDTAGQPSTSKDSPENNSGG